MKRKKLNEDYQIEKAYFLKIKDFIKENELFEITSYELEKLWVYNIEPLLEEYLGMIMEDDSIAVSATCVRIPVLSGHSESVYIETKEVAPIDEVKAAIAAFPGAVLEDDVANQIYPQAINAVGSRDTFVGRIRKDLDKENGIHMWVVSDNLLKGAAWNSVQIAETLHERGLVRPTAELKFELK